LYEVRLLPAAQRQLRKFDAHDRQRLSSLIESLATTPRPVGARAMVDEPGYLRVRSGDYRVIYEVIDKELIVIVAVIGHRRDVYRR
jgi:mRNA interferase RelE/StbE